MRSKLGHYLLILLAFLLFGFYVDIKIAMIGRPAEVDTLSIIATVTFHLMTIFITAIMSAMFTWIIFGERLKIVESRLENWNETVSKATYAIPHHERNIDDMEQRLKKLEKSQ